MLDCEKTVQSGHGRKECYAVYMLQKIKKILKTIKEDAKARKTQEKNIKRKSRKTSCIVLYFALYISRAMKKSGGVERDVGASDRTMKRTKIFIIHYRHAPVKILFFIAMSNCLTSWREKDHFPPLALYMSHHCIASSLWTPRR